MIHVVDERGSNRPHRVQARILNSEVIPALHRVVGPDLILPRRVVRKPFGTSGAVPVLEPEGEGGADLGVVAKVEDPILSSSLPSAGFRNIATHELAHYHEQCVRMRRGTVLLGDAALHGCWLRMFWSEFYAEHTACLAGWPGANASVGSAPWDVMLAVLRDIGGPHGWARTAHYLAYLSRTGEGNAVFEDLYRRFPAWTDADIDGLREETVRLYALVGLDLTEISGELV